MSPVGEKQDAAIIPRWLHLSKRCGSSCKWSRGSSCDQERRCVRTVFEAQPRIHNLASALIQMTRCRQSPHLHSRTQAHTLSRGRAKVHVCERLESGDAHLWAEFISELMFHRTHFDLRFLPPAKKICAASGCRREQRRLFPSITRPSCPSPCASPPRMLPSLHLSSCPVSSISS